MLAVMILARAVTVLTVVALLKVGRLQYVSAETSMKYHLTFNKMCEFKRTATEAHFRSGVSRARPISGGHAAVDQQIQGEFGSPALTVHRKAVGKAVGKAVWKAVGTRMCRHIVVGVSACSVCDNSEAQSAGRHISSIILYETSL